MDPLFSDAHWSTTGPQRDPRLNGVNSALGCARGGGLPEGETPKPCFAHAKLLETATRVAKLTVETISEAAVLRVRAERRAGQLLAAAPKQANPGGGASPPGRRRRSPEPTLEQADDGAASLKGRDPPVGRASGNVHKLTESPRAGGTERLARPSAVRRQMTLCELGGGRRSASAGGLVGQPPPLPRPPSQRRHLPAPPPPPQAVRVRSQTRSCSARERRPSAVQVAPRLPPQSPSDQPRNTRNSTRSLRGRSFKLGSRV